MPGESTFTLTGADFDLDVDSNRNTANRHKILGIPTLLLFKAGQVVEQRVGAVGKSELLKMVQPQLVA